MRAKVEHLEAKLLLEIDSNRQREDELLRTALSAAGLHARHEARRPLAAHATIEIEEEEEVPNEALSETEMIESDVRELAQQFIEAGESSGLVYSEDARALLTAEIRRNPDNYRR